MFVLSIWKLTLVGSGGSYLKAFANKKKRKEKKKKKLFFDFFNRIFVFFFLTKLLTWFLPYPPSSRFLFLLGLKRASKLVEVTSAKPIQARVEPGPLRDP